jgi:hypothetical protein
MAKYETLNSNSETKIAIDKMAKKYQMSRVDFLGAMVKYFEVTGVNPKDQVILSPAEELKKFRDTIISFMRKQESDFIKPTFGKMDTLIARFIKYIDEEAPKNSDAGGQNKVKSLALSGVIIKEEKKGSAENVVVKIDEYSDQYKELQEKLIKSEMKLNTTKKYLEHILSHTESKATHFDKKPVIELSMGEINDYRKYLKTL